MFPIESLLTMPTTKLTGLARENWLKPFIVRGFREGSTLSALYAQIVHTPVGMRKADFLKLAGGVYDTMEKATAIQELEPERAFLIKDLPKMKSSLDDRFWARVKISYITPDGEQDSIYLTWGFSEKKTKSEILDDAIESWHGYYFEEDLNVTGTEIMEMYKQW